MHLLAHMQDAILARGNKYCGVRSSKWANLNIKESPRNEPCQSQWNWADHNLISLLLRGRLRLPRVYELPKFAAKVVKDIQLLAKFSLCLARGCRILYYSLRKHALLSRSAWYVCIWMNSILTCFLLVRIFIHVRIFTIYWLSVIWDFIHSPFLNSTRTHSTEKWQSNDVFKFRRPTGHHTQGFSRTYFLEAYQWSLKMSNSLAYIQVKTKQGRWYMPIWRTWVSPGEASSQHFLGSVVEQLSP